MSGVTVEEVIRKCQGNKDASDVFVLDFSSCQSVNSDELFEKIGGFPNIKTLILKNVGLGTLDGFPVLPMLEELDLSENDISDDLNGLLKCVSLAKLTMDGCRLDTLEALAPLAKLPNLQSLSVNMCPVEKLENFNKKCFALLPNIASIGVCDRSIPDEADGDDDNEDNLAAENGDNDVGEDDEDEDDEEEDDSDEEIGIEALQKSGDLDDDDEEDYNPDEADLDECDDDFDDDEEDNDVDDEDTGANLSGAGVTGPRRPASKRRHDADTVDCAEGNGVTAPKVPATDGVEEAFSNGTNAK